MCINRKEVCKFLSGAFFVSSGVNWYMSYQRIAVPIFGYKVPPKFLAIRGCIHFVLFLVTTFFGFIKK
jgi:hypothetical protein